MHQVAVGNVYVFSSDDLRALIEHLRVEAPHLLSTLVVAVPDADTARQLAASGVTALVSRPRDTAGGTTELVIDADAPASRSGGLGALGSWRFWVMAGVAMIDAIVIVPVSMITVLLAALWFPRLLRRASRFLGALATAAEAG